MFNELPKLLDGNFAIAYSCRRPVSDWRYGAYCSVSDMAGQLKSGLRRMP